MEADREEQEAANTIGAAEEVEAEILHLVQLFQPLKEAHIISSLGLAVEVLEMEILELIPANDPLPVLVGVRRPPSERPQKEGLVEEVMDLEEVEVRLVELLDIIQHLLRKMEKMGVQRVQKVIQCMFLVVALVEKVAMEVVLEVQVA